MRWMTGLPLGAVAILAGCLGPESVPCPGGFVCPGGLACAEAPVFCEAPERVDACLGSNIADFNACSIGGAAGACRGGACYECTNELAGCAAPGWVPMVSNTTVNLRGVWVAGPGEAYAVGGDTVVRYDGLQWIAERIPDVELTAVWGSDPEHVFATTADGAIYQQSPTRTWEAVRDLGIPLTAIGGSSPDDVIALSTQGKIARSAAGWAIETITTTDNLYAIAVRSRDDAYVVGSRGLVLHSSGTGWTPSRASMSGQAGLNAIALAPGAAFAIGDGDVMTTSALRLAAGQSTWTSTELPGVRSTIFTGIWAGSDDEAFAVGVNGHLVRYAGTWSAVESGTGTNLNAIHGSDRTNVLAVGAGGTILHYTGQ